MEPRYICKHGIPARIIWQKDLFEYKKPAKLGDLLYPKIIENSPANWYVLLLDSQDNLYAIMEFS